MLDQDFIDAHGWAVSYAADAGPRLRPGDKRPWGKRGNKTIALSATDPAGWMRYDDACDFADMFPGAAYVGCRLERSNGYVVVDIDSAAAEKIPGLVRWLGSWTTYSQSSNGVHIVLKGRLPGPGRRANGVEMYDTDRYMIMCMYDTYVDEDTGEIFDTIRDDAQPLIDALYRRLGDLQSGPSASGQYVPAPSSDDWMPTEETADVDRALVGSLWGNLEFRALFSGDLLDHESQSEADAALIERLCFASADDATVARCFRRSKLGQRDKAQRHDYVSRTIQMCRRGLENRQQGPKTARGATIAPALVSPPQPAPKNRPEADSGRPSGKSAAIVAAVCGALGAVLDIPSSKMDAIKAALIAALAVLDDPEPPRTPEPPKRDPEPDADTDDDRSPELDDDMDPEPEPEPEPVDDPAPAQQHVPDPGPETDTDPVDELDDADDLDDVPDVPDLDDAQPAKNVPESVDIERVTFQALPSKRRALPLPPGAFGRCARWFAENARGETGSWTFASAALVAAIGGCAGGLYSVDSGPMGAYFFLSAASGAGKSVAEDVFDAFSRRGNSRVPSIRYITPTSQKSIYQALDENSGVFGMFWPEIARALVSISDNPNSIISGAFSALLGAFSMRKGTIEREIQYSNRANNITLSAGASIGFIADFQDRFLPDLIANPIMSADGTLARFTICRDHEQTRVRHMESEMPADIQMRINDVQRLESAKKTWEERIDINTTPSARAVFDEFYKKVARLISKCNKSDSYACEVYSDFCNRAGVRAQRIAGAIGVFNNVNYPTITDEIAAWACEWVMYEFSHIEELIINSSFNVDDLRRDYIMTQIQNFMSGARCGKWANGNDRRLRSSGIISGNAISRICATNSMLFRSKYGGSTLVSQTIQYLVKVSGELQSVKTANGVYYAMNGEYESYIPNVSIYGDKIS